MDHHRQQVSWLSNASVMLCLGTTALFPTRTFSATARPSVSFHNLTSKHLHSYCFRFPPQPIPAGCQPPGPPGIALVKLSTHLSVGQACDQSSILILPTWALSGLALSAFSNHPDLLASVTLQLFCSTSRYSTAPDLGPRPFAPLHTSFLGNVVPSHAFLYCLCLMILKFTSSALTSPSALSYKFSSHLHLDLC